MCATLWLQYYQWIQLLQSVLNDLPNQSLHIFNISESQHNNYITTVLGNELPTLKQIQIEMSDW